MIADIPWDLEKLKETPQAAWLNRRGTVHSLLYESEPFKGDRATEVFAYYASPGTLNADPKLDQNLPAIVLGHGGGGTAFDQWVEKWAAAGYAAIAMDLKGGAPMENRFQTVVQLWAIQIYFMPWMPLGINTGVIMGWLM